MKVYKKRPLWVYLAGFNYVSKSTILLGKNWTVPLIKQFYKSADFAVNILFYKSADFAVNILFYKSANFAVNIFKGYRKEYICVKLYTNNVNYILNLFKNIL